MDNQIDYYRKLRGLSVQELADKAGMSRVHLSNIKSGKKSLNTRHLQSLSDILNVTPAELLTYDVASGSASKATGFREPPSRSYNHAMPQKPHLTPAGNIDPFADFVELPIYDSAPSAEGNTWHRREATIIDTIMTETHRLHKEGNGDANHFFYIKASGDAMTPDIIDGDYILIDASQTTPHEGYIFVINSPEGLLLKRLEIFGEKVRAVSSNPRITPREATLASLDIMGRAIQRITKQDL